MKIPKENDGYETVTKQAPFSRDSTGIGSVRLGLVRCHGQEYGAVPPGAYS